MSVMGLVLDRMDKVKPQRRSKGNNAETFMSCRAGRYWAYRVEYDDACVSVIYVNEN